MTTLAAHIESAFAAAITPSSSNARWLSTDDSATPAYVEAANCWANDLADFSCVATYSSLTGRSGGPTAVHARFAITAKHFYTDMWTGATVHFLANDGSVVTRTVSDYRNVGSTDITVLMLSSDLPATVVPAKVFPTTVTDYYNFYTGDPRMPALSIHRGASETYKKANCLDVNVWGDLIGVIIPTDAERLALYEAMEVLDSGSPLLTVVNSSPVLFGTWYSSTRAPSLTAQIAAIQSAMTAMAGASRTLTQVDLSGFDLLNPGGGGSPVATKYLSANANYSAAVWLDAPAGSVTTAPTSTDSIDLNAKTLTVDQDITVVDIIGSGTLAVSGSRTLTCNLGRAAVTNTWTCTLSAAQTVALIGNILSGASGVKATVSGASTVFNVTGNVTGGGASAVYGVNITNGTVNLTGNSTGGSHAQAAGINLQSAGTLTINGNLIGATGLGLQALLGGSITVNGNSTANANSGFSILTGSTLVLNGTVTASVTAAGGSCGGGTVTVNGSIVGTAAWPGVAQTGGTFTFNPSTAQTVTLGGKVMYATDGIAQLATDTAAVDAAKASIKDDTTILTVTGTYDFQGAIDAAEAAQLATDIAAVEAGKANILSTATILTVTGTFDDTADDAAVAAAAAAAQLVTDTAAVNAAKADILNTRTLLGVTGTYEPIATSEDADQATGYLYCYAPDGTAEEDVTLTIKVVNPPPTAGLVLDLAERTGTSNSEGLVQFTGLFCGAQYAIKRGASGAWERFTVPDDVDTFAIDSFQGTDA
jgi:hypothetical protein